MMSGDEKANDDDVPPETRLGREICIGEQCAPALPAPYLWVDWPWLFLLQPLTMQTWMRPDGQGSEHLPKLNLQQISGAPEDDEVPKDVCFLGPESVMRRAFEWPTRWQDMRSESMQAQLL
jgi:hypothetical protein